MKRYVLLSLLVLVACNTLQAQQEKTPIILDTDLGSYIDDPFALALALTSPELELRGVTTAGKDAYTRALIVCRMLYLTGHRDIPVAAGNPRKAQPVLDGQFMYGLRATPKRPVKEPAIEFMYRQLKADRGKITLVTMGPLTNVALLLTKHPDCKPWIKRVVIMGGAVRVGYKGKPPVEWEWNIHSDIKAAQTVFQSGVPLVVAPLDATTKVKLTESYRKKIFNARTPLTYQLSALYQLWGKPSLTLYDPVALALSFKEKFCKMEDLRLEVDGKGFTRVVKGKPNARVATAIRVDDFLKWYVGRVTSGKPAPATVLDTNLAKPVKQTGLPARVHALEDYETEIERRWWLGGKPETKLVPAGSSRACRGVICNDFDGKMGNPLKSYTAVIFNPVPGPPMGKRTRLSFRCRLKGTSKLRVQIYSLSNGYHRHLTLTGLPQEQWQSITVAMTDARRPDGSGGPLTDERIDDIQFYTDPSAELVIDDIVLYEAASAKEASLFPRHLIFTGWFDSGRKDQHWLGDYDIVSREKTLAGKAARSVIHPKLQQPWIRLHLRGERPLGAKTRLRFRYKLDGCKSMQVGLVNRTARQTQIVPLKGLKNGTWAEADVDFAKAVKSQPAKGDKVDEIQFLLPKGTTLLIDDVLLYEPGG